MSPGRSQVDRGELAAVLVALAVVLLASSRTSPGRPALEVRASGVGDVTVDTSSNVSWVAGCFNPFVTATLSTDVGNHTNRLLILQVSTWSFVPSFASVPNWQPISGGIFPFSGPITQGGDSLFWLVAPAIGTGTITWSSGGGSGAAQSAAVLSLYNVDQTTPFVNASRAHVASPGFTITDPAAQTSRDAYVRTVMLNGANVGQYPSITTSTPDTTSQWYDRLKQSASCEGWAYAGFSSSASTTSSTFAVTDVVGIDYVSLDVVASPLPPAPPASSLPPGVFALILAVAIAGLIGLAAAAGMVRTADKNRERVAIAIVVITGAFIVVALGVAFSGLIG